MATRPMTTLIRKLVSASTSSSAYLYGILPKFTTVLSLAIISGAIAGTTLLLATASSILPVMAATVVAAFANYFFSREVQTAMLGLTPTSAYVKTEDGVELEQDWTYDIGIKKGHDQKVEYNFAKAMDHLRGVINARYPDEAPLPRIRIGTFAEHHYKLVVTGRNPGKAMIAIANPGVFHTFKGKPREFNALMLQALAQIKLRSTFSGMIVGVAMDFGQLLNSFKDHEFLPLKILGSAVSPFGQLLINAMSRTNAYYRADRMVAECGYGEDLIKAIDILNQPNNISRVNTHRHQYAVNLMSVQELPTIGALLPIFTISKKPMVIKFTDADQKDSYWFLGISKDSTLKLTQLDALPALASLEFDSQVKTIAVSSVKNKEIYEEINLKNGHIPGSRLEPTGRFAWFVKKGHDISDALRADSFPGEDETGYTALQFIDNLVMRSAYFIKELFSNAPRMGHRKEEIKAFLKSYQAKEGKMPEPQLPADPEVDYKFCNIKTLQEKLAKYSQGAHHHHAGSSDKHDGKKHQHQDDLGEKGPESVIFSNATQDNKEKPAEPTTVVQQPELGDTTKRSNNPGSTIH